MHAPRLERLELWFGDENYGAECSAAEVERLLTRENLKLRTLGPVNASFVHELVLALASSKLLEGLEELDFWLGALHDADVDLLVRHAAAFVHLQRINLSQNQLGEQQAELQAVWSKAMFGEQRHSSDYSADEPGRYVAVDE